MGSFSPWLFIIVGAAALLVVIPFTRSAAAFTESGGPATYGLVFGRMAGFELGWIYYVARTSGYAANLNVLADYLARWWGSAEQGAGRIGTILAVCAVLTSINLFGMKRALVFLSGFTVLKALPFLIAGIAAVVLFWPLPTPTLPPEMSGMNAGFLVVFYAFVGFENAVVPTGETKEPAATMPRAITLTIAITAMLYFVVQLGFATAFQGQAPSSNAPLIDLGSLLAGGVGAAIVMLAAICSLLGNLLGVSASTPRVTYAMGTRGDLPAWFAVVSPTLRSPANSILFLSTIVAILAISGSFIWLAVVSTLARMIVYPVTIAALPFAPHRPRLTWVHYSSGLAGIAICSWGMTQANAQAWLTLLALSAVGVLLYAVSKRGRPAHGKPTRA